MNKEKRAKRLLEEAQTYEDRLNNATEVSDFAYSYHEYMRVIDKLIWLNEVQGVSMCPVPRQHLNELNQNISEIINQLIYRALGAINSSGNQWAKDVNVLLNSIEENKIISPIMHENNHILINNIRNQGESFKNTILELLEGEEQKDEDKTLDENEMSSENNFPELPLENVVIPHYVVRQVTLKEKFIGTTSLNLWELEHVINAQAAKGYKLHTISTAAANSTGLFGGDRIQATMVFEKIQ